MNRRKIWFFLLFFLSISFSFARDGELSLVTINVWSGLDYQGTLKMGEYESKEVRGRRFELLVDNLTKLNPDVIAVNEANLLPGYARKLAKRLGYDQIHVIGNAGIKVWYFGIPTNLKEGDALLAKKELNLRKIASCRLSGDRFGIWSDWFTFHFKESNNLLIGEITVNGKDFCVAVTHLYAAMPNSERNLFYVMQKVNSGELDAEKSGEILKRLENGAKRRARELTNALECMKSIIPIEEPVIFMGDFNAEPGSPEYVILTTWRDFIDTYQSDNPEDPGYTWNPLNNKNISDLQLTRFSEKETDVYKQLQYINESTPRRIDYIFLSSHFSGEQIEESRLVFNEPFDDQYISDHFGVYTRIKLEQ